MVVTDGQIFKSGVQQEKGETARMSSFVGAIAIGDMVKTTLGPKGMDKVLQLADDNAKELQVTNDGATILKSIGVDNPIAKILVDISKVQDDEVGDGTTSVAVLASELLRTAEQLVLRKIHPQTIISGWRKAHSVAMKVIDEIAIDTSKNPEKFHSDLIDVACTTLSSKVLSSCKRHFAELCVKAALRIRSHSDLRAIQIIKVSGKSLEDSYLDDGFILQKKVGLNQPQRIENAVILIANTPMDTDKIKIFGSRTRVDSVAKIAEVEQAERDKMKEKVEKIVSSGCSVFINRQLIYNYPEQLFADAGIMAIEHADFEGIERLALVLDGEIASSFENVKEVRLGRCKCIEQIMIGEEQMLRFSGVALGEACTLVIRGSTQQMLDEAERSVHDALCILCQMLRRDPRIVYGGGCTEMRIYKAIDDESLRTPGKESIAMRAYANALRQIPIIIADNGGYDSEDLVSNLVSAISNGNVTAGLDMNNGTIGDMASLGITESYVLKKQVITSGTEAAEMILRVDEIIKQEPRKRVPDNRHH